MLRDFAMHNSRAGRAVISRSNFFQVLPRRCSFIENTTLREPD